MVIYIKRIMLFFISITFCCLMGFSIESESKYIFIDPGHGGFDGGAYVDNIKEADLNLQIALKLKGVFEKGGYKVKLTREDDVDLSTDVNHKKRTDIQNRVKMINESNCLLYISIHQNIYTNDIYRGAQCFYNSYNGLSNILANNIQESIKKQLNNTTRNSKSISGIYLTDNVYKPGILIECGFMSNKEELLLLQDNSYQNSLVNAIYYGTLNYLLLL